MVKAKLQMDHNPEPIDASDALAIALCYDHQFRMEDL
jgi:Holliday junction resolvasome RuvABC endonuclease subunit